MPLSVIVALGLASCDSETPETNAAANPVELARYLPEDTDFLHTIDVTRAREELDLPEDANALPTIDRAPRPRSPESQLFNVTSNAFPVVADAFARDVDAKGVSPLDGTLIRAAAGGESSKHGWVGIVSTAESLEDVVSKLELAGYSAEGQVYVAGRRTPEPASPVVADAGSGRIVFADGGDEAKEVLRLIANDAEPGQAAEALEPASGSVRLAMTHGHEKRSCVRAFAAAMEATGEGAALALTISGQKPDPERFDPKPLKGIDAGTPTVLVDALLVPISVKKPLRDGLDAITQVMSTFRTVASRKLGERDPASSTVAPPFNSYDCP